MAETLAALSSGEGQRGSRPHGRRRYISEALWAGSPGVASLFVPHLSCKIGVDDHVRDRLPYRSARQHVGRAVCRYPPKGHNGSSHCPPDTMSQCLNAQVSPCQCVDMSFHPEQHRLLVRMHCPCRRTLTAVIRARVRASAQARSLLRVFPPEEGSNLDAALRCAMLWGLPDT